MLLVGDSFKVEKPQGREDGGERGGFWAPHKSWAASLLSSKVTHSPAQETSSLRHACLVVGPHSSSGTQNRSAQGPRRRINPGLCNLPCDTQLSVKETTHVSGRVLGDITEARFGLNHECEIC